MKDRLWVKNVCLGHRMSWDEKYCQRCRRGGAREDLLWPSSGVDLCEV